MSKPDITGRTIELGEHGAVLTIQVNRAFAERLLDYIEHLEDSKKAEGDNQVLAGFLQSSLSRALFKTSAKERWRAQEMERLRHEADSRSDAVLFWQSLVADIESSDGFGRALATIDAKVAEHLTRIAEISAKLEPREGGETRVGTG